MVSRLRLWNSLTELLFFLRVSQCSSLDMKWRKNTQIIPNSVWSMTSVGGWRPETSATRQERRKNLNIWKRWRDCEEERERTHGPNLYVWAGDQLLQPKKRHWVSQLIIQEPVNQSCAKTFKEEVAWSGIKVTHTSSWMKDSTSLRLFSALIYQCWTWDLWSRTSRRRCFLISSTVGGMDGKLVISCGIQPTNQPTDGHSKETTSLSKGTNWPPLHLDGGIKKVSSLFPVFTQCPISRCPITPQNRHVRSRGWNLPYQMGRPPEDPHVISRRQLHLDTTRSF